MGQSADKKQVRSSIYIITLIIAVLSGTAIYYAWPYLSAISSPEQARELITGAGGWGPLVFILMQAAQVLIAPIPGQIIGLIGGYLFGPFLGLIYTITGATIGFTAVFYLTRKLGRPFVERFVSKKILGKFDHLTEEKGVLVFFLIFLLPAFPDDLISFIAGLTTIRIRTLVLISIAGRLPGYAVLSFTGNGLAYENLNPVIATGILMVMLSAISWWKRAWLREFVRREDRISFVNEQWKASWKTIIIWATGIIILTVILIKLANVILMK